MAEQRVRRRLAAILAADVVGYSRLIEADEEGTRARLRKIHSELIDPRIASDGGRIVKTTGDGILVEFPSAVDAVRNALAIQTAMAGHNADLPEHRKIVFRVGINLGDVIIEGDDIHGDGVNVAARLEGLCKPGEVYISGNVHEQVAGKLDTIFDDLGEQTVKNISKPVRVYRVRVATNKISQESNDGVELSLPDKPSIAVLPFENMSGDPEQNYFTDGMTEDLITDLSKISGLFVIARNSSFAYKGKQVDKQVDMRVVGRELGVRHILEGSVRRAGDRVRINAQLIDAATGGHLWAERYDGDLSDIFSLQDEIGKKIVSALEVQLTEQEIERQKLDHVPDLEAYDHFIRGRQIVHDHYFQHSQVSQTAPSVDILRSAREQFERAIELDPEFAGGYAGLSWSYSLGVRHGLSEDPLGDKENAYRLANLAVETSDSFGWAHTALGSILLMYGRHDEAVAASRRAVELQPSNGDAQAYLGFHLFWSGMPEQALAPLELALRLDPRFVGRSTAFIALARFGMDQYEDAAKGLETAISTRMVIHFTLAFLAAAYWKLGRIEDAKETIETLLRRYPGFTIGRMRGLLPYKHDSDIRRVSDALHDAGLPQ
jgi:TolB-like protein